MSSGPRLHSAVIDRGIDPSDVGEQRPALLRPRPVRLLGRSNSLFPNVLRIEDHREPDSEHAALGDITKLDGYTVFNAGGFPPVIGFTLRNFELDRDTLRGVFPLVSAYRVHRRHASVVVRERNRSEAFAPIERFDLLVLEFPIDNKQRYAYRLVVILKVDLASVEADWIRKRKAAVLDELVAFFLCFADRVRV